MDKKNGGSRVKRGVNGYPGHRCMLPVTLGVQRLQGRGIEESSRDHNRNRSPLNQYENRDDIVLDKVHGRGGGA